MQRPRLLPNYDIRLEPGKEGAEDTLIFTSGWREVRLSGRRFGDFLKHVVPLLDGKQSVDEIEQRVAGVFAPADVSRAISLLAEQRVLADVGRSVLDEQTRERAAPVLHYLGELGLDPEPVYQRLSGSTVAVIGNSGAGAFAAASLTQSGAGQVRVSNAQDADLSSELEGVNFAIAAVPPGLTSVLYKMNRICRDRKIPWTSVALDAHEALLGPTVIPERTACFVCYKMRAVACAGDPASAFAREKFLDGVRRDDSHRRESLPFLNNVLGALAGLEAFKFLAGLEPSAAGRVVALDALTLAITHHVVLRKPWCPDCGR